MSSSYYTRFVLVLALIMIFSGQTALSLSEEHSPQRDVATLGEIVIDMESYAFSPSDISVAVGSPIKLLFRNQSFLVPHNFLLDDPHGVRILDADITSGENQSHTLTLTEPGIYPFYCDKQFLFFPTHREEGMEGRLIVQ